MRCFTMSDLHYYIEKIQPILKSINKRLFPKELERLVKDFNADTIFMNACVNSDINIAKNIDHLISDTTYNHVMEVLCSQGKTEIVSQLYEMKAKHENINTWFQYAAIHGRINVMRFLYSSSERDNIDIDNALGLCCENKQYDAIKLLCIFKPELSLCKH